MSQFDKRETQAAINWNFNALKDKKIAILGYGNQGRAHLLNLKDSGAVHIVAGVREDSSHGKKQAEQDGVSVLPLEKAVDWAEVIMLTIPDECHADIYKRCIEPFFRPGGVLLFAHSASVRFGWVEPRADLDVGLIAPKGPGRAVRESYLIGSGVPGLLSVYQDKSGQLVEILHSYAVGLGLSRVGVLNTSFAEEAETDLFGEQAVLCGGLLRLIKAGFETLKEAGYSEEVAFFECVYEMKLIVDLLSEGGIGHLLRSISNTAEYGVYASDSFCSETALKSDMKKILTSIQSGAFAERWRKESESGKKEFFHKREIYLQHDIEKVREKMGNMIKT